MTRPRKIFLLLASGTLLLGLAAWALWAWYADPVRSVQRQWKQLLSLTEKRQWEQLETGISPHFSSEWGYDRKEALGLAEEALRHFFFLRFVAPEDPEVQITSPQTAVLRARLEIEGSGSPLAQMAIRQLAEHPGAFLFTFVQEAKGPGGWRLTHLAHENSLPW